MATIQWKDKAAIEREQYENDLRAEMADLKRKLQESDFKTLPDYDQDNTQVIDDRQAWRDRIRKIKIELEIE